MATKTRVPAKTEVKKTVTHDRLSVEARFPSSAMVRWTVSRDRDTLTAAISNDAVTLREQGRALEAWLKPRHAAETFAERADRFAELCARCSTGAELVAAVSTPQRPSLAEAVESPRRWEL